MLNMGAISEEIKLHTYMRNTTLMVDSKSNFFPLYCFLLRMIGFRQYTKSVDFWYFERGLWLVMLRRDHALQQTATVLVQHKTTSKSEEVHGQTVLAMLDLIYNFKNPEEN